MMENARPSNTSTQPAWTWADQVSTYRFWGLLAFFTLFTASLWAGNPIMPLLLNQQGLAAANIGMLTGAALFGAIFGIYIVWAASRTRPFLVLLLAGAVQLCGTLVAMFSGNLAVAVAAMFAAGIGQGTILLGVPAIIAGGRGGVQMFVVAFGVLFVASRAFGEIAIPYQINSLFAAGTIYVMPLLLWVMVAMMVLGIVCLLPLARSSFDGPPPGRASESRPGGRNLCFVFIFTLVIPFYELYWLHRAHAEAQNVAPSPNIPSPWAAVGLAFVPLVLPIVLASLAEQINAEAPPEDFPPISHRWVFWATLLFFPIGSTIVQSTLNRYVERT